MSNLSKIEFLEIDDGLDYLFARLSAIYGAGFARHWDGIEPDLIRQEWKRQLGNFLTYVPTIDYAIDRLSGDFPPSAIKFREFCNAGPAVPRKELRIENKPAPVDPQVVAEAKRKLAQMRGGQGEQWWHK
jgi:hypothetical protein